MEACNKVIGLHVCCASLWLAPGVYCKKIATGALNVRVPARKHQVSIPQCSHHGRQALIREIKSINNPICRTARFRTPSAQLDRVALVNFCVIVAVVRKMWQVTPAGDFDVINDDYWLMAGRTLIAPPNKRRPPSHHAASSLVRRVEQCCHRNALFYRLGFRRSQSPRRYPTRVAILDTITVMEVRSIFTRKRQYARAVCPCEAVIVSFCGRSLPRLAGCRFYWRFGWTGWKGQGVGFNLNDLRRSISDAKY